MSAQVAPAERAWREAKDLFVGNLSDLEKSYLAHSTIIDAFSAVSDLEGQYELSSKSRKVGSLLRGPLEVVGRLAPALDVFSQVEPSIICPIWGSLRVMVMVRPHHNAR